MSTPPSPRKKRGPLAAFFLGLDAWLDSSLYEIRFKAGEFWEAATIFSRRFRLRGWRRLLIELLSEGFTMGAGGAVVNETDFTIPGMGRLVVQSISRRDFPVIQGAVMMIAGIYVLVNLAVDILYVYVDPRVRYGGN